MYGDQGREESPTRREDPEMRSEELVRRAHEEVGADPVEVGEAMLCQVHPVDRDEGADRLRSCHEVGGRRDRPDGVGGERERDQLRARRQSGLEGLDVDRDVFIADVHPPHGGTRVGRGQHPRADVRVVVQPGHDHLVLRTERLREGTRDMEQQRRRVRTEDDLVRVGAGEVGRGPPRVRDDPVRLLARRERPVRVAHPSSVVARDRLDHVVRHLGAAGGIDEHHGPAVVAETGESGEAGTDGVEVEHRHRLPHRVVPGKPGHGASPAVPASQPGRSSGVGQPGRGASHPSRGRGRLPAEDPLDRPLTPRPEVRRLLRREESVPHRLGELLSSFHRHDEPIELDHHSSAWSTVSKPSGVR